MRSLPSFEVFHSLRRNFITAANENRFLPFFSFPFLCLRDENLHVLRGDVFVKAPFFELAFPFSLTGKTLALGLKEVSNGFHHHAVKPNFCSIVSMVAGSV